MDTPKRYIWANFYISSFSLDFVSIELWFVWITGLYYWDNYVSYICNYGSLNSLVCFLKSDASSVCNRLSNISSLLPYKLIFFILSLISWSNSNFAILSHICFITLPIWLYSIDYDVFNCYVLLFFGIISVCWLYDTSLFNYIWLNIVWKFYESSLFGTYNVYRRFVLWEILLFTSFQFF